MNWVHSYIGKKWSANGRGPLVYDCWGLVWHVYQNVKGIALPPYPFYYDKGMKNTIRMFEAAALSKDWERVRDPSDLCVAALSRGNEIHHVGIFVPFDGGLVLHAHREAGAVIAQPPSQMKQVGWRLVEFYQWRGDEKAG